MRMLAMRGGLWTPKEQADLLDYCESDVLAVEKLLSRMLPDMNIPQALLRGRFMAAAARMESIGIPMDPNALLTLRERWESVQDRLIERVDAEFGIYEGQTFKVARFAEYLANNGIPWPRLESGRLALDDSTFRDMARVFPQIEPIRQLRSSLSDMRLADLAVGTDGRNRCMLSAYRARTGRNQPSNSKFIFGAPRWLRGLIQPSKGYGLSYIDWSQQEFGIAAALSQDPAMMEAYSSGDPYLSFAKQAGAVPKDATRKTHGAIRDQFKACALAVQYGMGEESLAQRIARPVYESRELLRLHRVTYCKFWRWSDAAVDFAMLNGFLQDVFGWKVQVGTSANPRSLRNFPMQANGAEMLRLACCLATERGIRVCAPVHDAVLIEAPEADLSEAVQQMQKAMDYASSTVLSGFTLRSDAKLIRYPDRLLDDGGVRMWNVVWDVIREAA